MSAADLGQLAADLRLATSAAYGVREAWDRLDDDARAAWLDTHPVTGADYLPLVLLLADRTHENFMRRVRPEL